VHVLLAHGKRCKHDTVCCKGLFERKHFWTSQSKLSSWPQGDTDDAAAGGGIAEEDDFDEEEEGLGSGQHGDNTGGASALHKEHVQQEQAGGDEESGLAADGSSWGADGQQPSLPAPAGLQRQQQPVNGKYYAPDS
jgi:hypothetical protein